MRISLSSSMAGFWRGPCSLFYLQSWSSFLSIHSWVQFLSTDEFSPGLPGAAWKLLEECQHLAPNSGKLRISYVYFTLFILLLILFLVVGLLVKLFLYSICKSLFLFLLFPSSGGRVGVNRERLSFYLLTPCFKPWQHVREEHSILASNY